jgi:adenylate cyclase class IV
MIEIERKIEAVPAFLEHVSSHGVFVKKQTIHDTYFDTADYRYTGQNMWLRARDSLYFELKRVIKGSHTIDRYEEITDQKEILRILGISQDEDFVTSLKSASIVPFASFVTHREKYSLSRCTVDVDIADFGDFLYKIAEIECLVEQQSEIEEAEQYINDFLRQFSVNVSKKPLAKLSMYLSRYQLNHYKFLQQRGII